MVRQVHHSGVGVWVHDVSRLMVTGGELRYLIDEMLVTGVAACPATLARDVTDTSGYDDDLRVRASDGGGAEDVAYRLALTNLRAAAHLLEPVHRRTNRVDGWVSLPISPLHAFDAAAGFSEARRLSSLAACSNLLVEIAGAPESLPVIEEAIFAGIPVNVTALFSAPQYLAASDAYLRGIERRIDAGLNPDVRSVASIVVSRSDRGTEPEAASGGENRSEIATVECVSRAYREVLDSDRMGTVMSFGGQPQRLLWSASGGGTPDPSLILTLRDLVSPFTITSMPVRSLLAFADYGSGIGLPLPKRREQAGSLDDPPKRHGVDADLLADRLQREEIASASESWNGLLAAIEAKRHAIMAPTRVA
jgi:transaldolase